MTVYYDKGTITYAVYLPRGSLVYVCCPRDQVPYGARVILEGSRHHCEHFILFNHPSASDV
jgi:hypothetical protein